MCAKQNSSFTGGLKQGELWAWKVHKARQLVPCRFVGWIQAHARRREDVHTHNSSRLPSLFNAKEDKNDAKHGGRWRGGGTYCKLELVAELVRPICKSSLLEMAAHGAVMGIVASWLHQTKQHPQGQKTTSGHP